MYKKLIFLSCVCALRAERVRPNEESLRVLVQDPSAGLQEIKLFRELNPTLLVKMQDEFVDGSMKKIEEKSGVHDEQKKKIMSDYLEQLRRIGETGYSEIRNKNLEFHRKKPEQDVEESKSYHENPEEIPTKVNYPGQGQWARKGTKHKPHVTVHKHLYPDIYDEEREGYFNNLKKYAEDYNTDATDHEKEPQDFVPYTTYSQVRRSEVEKTVPKKHKNNKDKRLKEIQKQSKAHTVYTEEGYEDSAYDHGRTEKTGDKLEKDRRTREEDEKIQPEAPQRDNNEENESENEEIQRQDRFEPEKEGRKEGGESRRSRRDEAPRRINPKFRRNQVPTGIQSYLRRNLEEYSPGWSTIPRRKNKFRPKGFEREAGEPSKYFTFENEDWFQKYRFDNIGDFFNVPPDEVEAKPVVEEIKTDKKEEITTRKNEGTTTDANKEIKAAKKVEVEAQKRDETKTGKKEGIKAEQEGTNTKKVDETEEKSKELVRKNDYPTSKSNDEVKQIPPITRRIIHVENPKKIEDVSKKIEGMPKKTEETVRRRNSGSLSRKPKVDLVPRNIIQEKLAGEERLRKIQERRRKQAAQTKALRGNGTKLKTNGSIDENAEASQQYNRYILENQPKKSLDNDYVTYFKPSNVDTSTILPVEVKYYAEIPTIRRLEQENIENSHPPLYILGNFKEIPKPPQYRIENVRKLEEEAKKPGDNQETHEDQRRIDPPDANETKDKKLYLVIIENKKDSPENLNLTQTGDEQDKVTYEDTSGLEESNEESEVENFKSEENRALYPVLISNIQDSYLSNLFINKENPRYFNEETPKAQIDPKATAEAKEDSPAIPEENQKKYYEKESYTEVHNNKSTQAKNSDHNYPIIQQKHVGIKNITEHAYLPAIIINQEENYPHNQQISEETNKQIHKEVETENIGDTKVLTNDRNEQEISKKLEEGVNGSIERNESIKPTSNESSDDKKMYNKPSYEQLKIENTENVEDPKSDAVDEVNLDPSEENDPKNVDTEDYDESTEIENTGDGTTQNDENTNFGPVLLENVQIKYPEVEENGKQNHVTREKQETVQNKQQIQDIITNKKEGRILLPILVGTEDNDKNYLKKSSEPTGIKNDRSYGPVQQIFYPIIVQNIPERYFKNPQKNEDNTNDKNERIIPENTGEKNSKPSQYENEESREENVPVFGVKQEAPSRIITQERIVQQIEPKIREERILIVPTIEADKPYLQHSNEQGYRKSNDSENVANVSHPFVIQESYQKENEKRPKILAKEHEDTRNGNEEENRQISYSAKTEDGEENDRRGLSQNNDDVKKFNGEKDARNVETKLKKQTRSRGSKKFKHDDIVLKRKLEEAEENYPRLFLEDREKWKQSYDKYRNDKVIGYGEQAHPLTLTEGSPQKSDEELNPPTTKNRDKNAENGEKLRILQVTNRENKNNEHYTIYPIKIEEVKRGYFLNINADELKHNNRNVTTKNLERGNNSEYTVLPAKIEEINQKNTLNTPEVNHQYENQKNSPESDRKLKKRQETAEKENYQGDQNINSGRRGILNKTYEDTNILKHFEGKLRPYPINFKNTEPTIHKDDYIDEGGIKADNEKIGVKSRNTQSGIIERREEKETPKYQGNINWEDERNFSLNNEISTHTDKDDLKKDLGGIKKQRHEENTRKNNVTKGRKLDALKNKLFRKTDQDASRALPESEGNSRKLNEKALKVKIRTKDNEVLGYSEYPQKAQEDSPKDSGASTRKDFEEDFGEDVGEGSRESFRDDPIGFPTKYTKEISAEMSEEYSGGASEEKMDENLKEESKKPSREGSKEEESVEETHREQRKPEDRREDKKIGIQTKNDEVEEENRSQKNYPKESNGEVSEKTDRNLKNAQVFDFLKLPEAQSLVQKRSNVEGTSKNTNTPKVAKTESEDDIIHTVMDEETFGKKLRKRRSLEEEPKGQLDEEKYPNYNSKVLEKTSSFRYAENPANILVKKKNEMVLYDGVEEVECPETGDIDPLPENVENPKNETSKSNRTDYDPKTRIKGKLSTQIDCLKRRYFGDNPLDNPLFEEDYDETVPSSVPDEHRAGKAVEEILDQPKAEPYVMKIRIVRRRPQNPGIRRNPQRGRPVKYGERPKENPNKYFSEVHYKEEIKPSEQLNVFADIINNIKSSNGDTEPSGSKSEEVYISKKPSTYYKYRVTTSKPFLPTPIPTEKRKRLPIRILPEHKNADEIIIVKKPPRVHQPKWKEETKKDNGEGEESLIKNVEELPVNKFYYLGLRPPPKEPYNHPNFYNPDMEKQKVSSPKRRRTKRSRGYAEIKRDRNETVDDVDDYVPHRERNFHYDEKTGKIVYDKKIEEPAEEAFEYDYVEEPTHPPPKKKTEPKRFPPTPPPGPNYLDYIKMLKSHPNYSVIEDPKPMEKEEMTVNAVESSSSSTGLPEFLSILNKVKSDKSYKIYLDPIPESKNGKKEEISRKGRKDEEEEETDEKENVQNSPGAQGILSSDSSLSASDTSEFLPKAKSYSPKTSIDTSKYTDIRRSRVKTKDDVEEETKVPLEEIFTTTPQSQTIEIPTPSIKPTTPIEETSEVAKHETKTGRTLRRRPLTPQEVTTASTSPRLPQRRQRGRARYRSSTPPTTKKENLRSRRNLQRRNYEIPKNHRRYYAKTRNDIERFKPTPRTITLKLINQTDISRLVNGSKSEKNDPKDVDVFGKVDGGKKHGGNYKYKKVQIKITRNYEPGKENEEQIQIKPKEFYDGSTLAERINTLKENNNYELTETFIEEQNTPDDEEEFAEETTRKLDVTTKKVPNIIKDPSKRLYFYAPI